MKIRVQKDHSPIMYAVIRILETTITQANEQITKNFYEILILLVENTS